MSEYRSVNSLTAIIFPDNIPKNRKIQSCCITLSQTILSLKKYWLKMSCSRLKWSCYKLTGCSAAGKIAVLWYQIIRNVEVLYLLKNNEAKVNCSSNQIEQWVLNNTLWFLGKAYASWPIDNFLAVVLCLGKKKWVGL